MTDAGHESWIISRKMKNFKWSIDIQYKCCSKIANNLFIETMKSYQDTFDNKYATNQFVCQ